MLMKSLWEKASEYGTKAKGYLQGDGKRSAEVEEVEKAYSEKFNNLKKEIEVFQKDTVSQYDQKIKHLNDLVGKLNKENESANERNKDLEEENNKIKEENKQINDLNEKIRELEEKLITNEKEKNDLSAEIIRIKENQIKENFVNNFENLKKEIEEINSKVQINEEEVKLHLQEVVDKLNEYLNKEEKEEFTSLKEELVKEFSNVTEKIEAENKKKNEERSEFLEQLDKTVKENFTTLNEKLSEYSLNSEKVSQENNILKSELINLKEEVQSKEKKIEDCISDLNRAKEEHKKIEGELNKRINSLIENEQNLTKDKEELEAKLNESKEKITELENTIKTAEDDMKELKLHYTTQEEQLREENIKLGQSVTKIIQTFKQFFLMLLEEDIFIDLIEKTFKNLDSDTFFEEVYKLSNLIKPKLQFKIYNSFLSNDELLNKLGKYNLDENVESQIQNYIELNNIEQITKLRDEGDSFIQKLLSELVNYIESLNATMNKQTKTVTELNAQLKSAMDTIDESKKNESDKYELLNKHIAKLQQDCREGVKTEKLLRDNIEVLEGNLKDLRNENEKIAGKLKTLNGMYDEMTKDKTNLTEKITTLTQQCELFRVENTELIDKSANNSEEINQLNNKLEQLTKEKNELNQKLSEMEKLKVSLHDKIDVITQKDLEITQLKNSFMDLEEFINTLKSEKEHNAEIHNKQIFEMATEIQSLKESLRSNEDKLLSESPLDQKKYEDMEKVITDLEMENKHLKEQKDKMKKYSEEILMKVKNDLKDTEYLIDKRMISNILMKYFDGSANEKLKLALLDTLANFMGYNNDERRKIGLHVNNSNVKVTSSNNGDKLKDLSDELYNFILNA